MTAKTKPRAIARVAPLSGPAAAAGARPAHWLMKSEPAEFSIDDLVAAPRRTTPWFGVRNYQARNYMRDAMRIGDLALFYHSSCDEPGVARSFASGTSLVFSTSVTSTCTQRGAARVALGSKYALDGSNCVRSA